MPRENEVWVRHKDGTAVRIDRVRSDSVVEFVDLIEVKTYHLEASSFLKGYSLFR